MDELPRGVKRTPGGVEIDASEFLRGLGLEDTAAMQEEVVRAARLACRTVGVTCPFIVTDDCPACRGSGVVAAPALLRDADAGEAIKAGMFPGANSWLLRFLTCPTCGGKGSVVTCGEAHG